MIRSAFNATNLTVLVITALTTSLASGSLSLPANSPYFAIEVVDRQTGRGVPLVELKTTNNLRDVTDSHGVIAFLEPGLMDREVFFHVKSHGYEYPKDGFGYRGVRLKTIPGTTATIEIDRINVAERLYRVTGQGIYRDSVLAGRPVPLEHPVLNGQVMGQDSVFTCRYRDQIFWLWGDTNRPSYPLGHFKTSGAFSALPGRGGLDPAVGVDLDYYVDETGFSRPVAALSEPGLIWLDALMTVPDPNGTERLVARFDRLKGLGTVLERGLMVFNDTTETFEPLVRSGVEFLPYRNTGHAFAAKVRGRSYYYFTCPSPMGPRLRVRARWEDIIDANRYEVLTALMPEDKGQNTENRRLRTGNGKHQPSVTRLPSSDLCWVKFGDLLAARNEAKVDVIEALEREAKDAHVYDIESGKAITPHNGTVYYNAYRQHWIGIFVQHFGDPSTLGEVWYAEADTPIGPWAYARRIVTHDKYSFYNPKHHPLFDQDGGRTIYFEGTYSYTFSGSEETATPRYDYNQIMYRLNLDDPRLVLPVPVYCVKIKKTGKMKWLLGSSIVTTWHDVQSVAFYAMGPENVNDDLIGVYTIGTPAGTSQLTTETLEVSASPVFCALPPAETPSHNPLLVNLYEYRHADSGKYLYDTDPQLNREGWKCAEEPLCRVWKTPPGPLLFDPYASAPQDN